MSNKRRYNITRSIAGSIFDCHKLARTNFILSESMYSGFGDSIVSSPIATVC